MRPVTTEIETLATPLECEGCGKPITQRPFVHVQVRRYLPRRGLGEYTEHMTSGDYHETCWST